MLWDVGSDRSRDDGRLWGLHYSCRHYADGGLQGMNFPSPALSGGTSPFFDDSRRGCPGREVCNLHDWTCLCDASKCRKRFQEVGESPHNPRPRGLILPLDASLPLYVPMVRHGSMRKDAFMSPVVALSTFDLLRQSKDRCYGPRFSTAEELRHAFRLRSDAQILLVSVAKDKKLETYWTNRNSENVPEALSALGVQGITVPNYSSFVDAPSIHTRWNLQRMHRAAMEFSSAGMAVVPHLNARTSGVSD
ncbi:DUF4417 domain-containing protein [Archangium violaceum]|nr:DUF4417 domain-containing protein [Archangium violaceum]